jgi:hypothetical protein
MQLNALVVAALFILAGFPALSVAEQETVAETKPPIEDLGEGRYRIGAITVDKTARKFSLDGKILHLTRPLEYVAVKTEGHKGYESLLELETSAVEFQLACILVGLDDEKSVKPRFQFDDNEVGGQAVDITVSWEVEGDVKTVSAASAMTTGNETFGDEGWVYIGSMQSPQDGSLLAEMSGTLIGFVHDPLSIIEHRKGAPAGSYGMVTGNADILPPEGSTITLTVSVIPD